MPWPPACGTFAVISTSTASTPSSARTASCASCFSRSFTGQAGVVSWTWNATLAPSILTFFTKPSVDDVPAEIGIHDDAQGVQNGAFGGGHVRSPGARGAAIVARPRGDPTPGRSAARAGRIRGERMPSVERTGTQCRAPEVWMHILGGSLRGME